MTELKNHLVHGYLRQHGLVGEFDSGGDAFVDSARTEIHVG